MKNIFPNGSRRTLAAGAVLLGAGLMTSSVDAAQPQPWQMDLQPAATLVMSELRWFEDYTLWFVVPITLAVMFLLGLVAFLFRASRNPVASRNSHNTVIEVIWTVAPVLILLFLAIPSFQLLNLQYAPPEEPEMTIKATGLQWYWNFEHQGEEPLSYDSLLLSDADREAAGKSDMAAYPRLLTVDNEMVVPVDTTIRLLVTAGDVLHSFAMPSFGVKVDAVPGRLNETWFNVEREGVYYGQCSELCGKDHAFMPIAIRAVSKDQYAEWLTAAASDVGAANRALVARIEEEKKNIALAAR